MDFDSKGNQLGYNYSSVKVNEEEKTSDHEQKPEQKSLWAKTNETWTFELGGLVLGFLCLAATVAILYLYDNKTAPNWAVTLNFALSLIGNIGFASTLFGIHSAIAQYKWILFSKTPRPLSQLGIFHRARGSALGVFELLFELGSHPTIIAGGLAIILGIFWGPFTQNLIRYESGPVVSAGEIALLARNVYYGGHGQLERAGFFDVDPMLQLNMLNSLLMAPNSRDVNIPDYVCPTGNCTWPPAATLAFCSQCADLTAQISRDCEEEVISGKAIQRCIASIPSSGCLIHSHSLWEANESFLNISQVNSSTLQYHSIRRVSGKVLGGKNIDKRQIGQRSTRPFVTKADFSATECWLRPCVRSIQASVENGVYEENLLDTYSGALDERWDTILKPPWGADKGIYASPDGVNLTSFWMHSPNVSTSVGTEGYDRLFTSFVGAVETLDAHTGLDFRGDGPYSSTIVRSMLSIIFDNKFNASACGSPNDDTFACVVDALAQGITKTVRDSGLKEHGRLAASEEDAVRGTVYTTATFVRVQWYWIGLPVAVWLLGVVTWAVIVFRSSAMGLPTWRDDILPLVFLYNKGMSSGEGEEETRDGHHDPLSKGPNGPDDRVRGLLLRSMSETGVFEYDSLLRAYRQSSWAYQVAANRITVQLRHYGGENVEEGVEAPVIRLQPISKA
ncbi:Protein of unknown function (DUF3176) domain containing protein [Rhypophila sp. PSN 637]